MGCNVACKTSKKNEDQEEILPGNKEPLNSRPPISNLHMSVDCIREISGLDNNLRTAASLAKKGSFQLNLNKSKFVNEKKAKITDYYELLDVMGEGSVLT